MAAFQDTYGATKGTAMEIVEVFEDLLQKHDIYIPNEDREQSENPCSIYGVDYGNLVDEIYEILADYIDE